MTLVGQIYKYTFSHTEGGPRVAVPLLYYIQPIPLSLSCYIEPLAVA
jgi:hypothetical protein